MDNTMALLLSDTYKQCHDRMYPKGLTKLVSYWVPRKSMLENQNEMVFFGLQAFIKEYLIGYFQKNFFDLSEDEMDKINHCRKIVKEQISYTAFEQNKFYRIELVDELVELMTEIFMMPDESFERVNGTEKSIAVIKSRFCKINQLHIEYVLDSMQKNQTNIGNIKAYLLTALYNSTITMDSYYQARVNYDLRENF